jgi:hypothetical protein
MNSNIEQDGHKYELLTKIIVISSDSQKLMSQYQNSTCEDQGKTQPKSQVASLGALKECSNIRPTQYTTTF